MGLFDVQNMFQPNPEEEKKQLVRPRVNIQMIKRNMMKSSSSGRPSEIHNLKSIWNTAKGFCKVPLNEYNMNEWHELAGCR